MNEHKTHHHAPKTHGRAFALAIILNTVFVGVEFAYGFLANSTALMADAGHNLSDVMSLVLAWGAAILARKAPKGRYTYGLRSSSILAALANAMILLIACGAIAWEAFSRFSSSPEVMDVTVIWVASIGIAVNGASAWLFLSGRKGDVNIRGAYLHLVADAAVSLGVVLAGIAMWLTDWYWLDSAVSLLIVVVIVYGTWGLLRESLHLALNAVPAHIDVVAVEHYLRELPGVSDLHDLHIWGMSTTESALTVHLVMPAGYPGDTFMDNVTYTLKEQFHVQHSTLQMEQEKTVHRCILSH